MLCVGEFSNLVIKAPYSKIGYIAWVLGGRLIVSGVIYWSQCVEGLIVMCVVYIGC